MKKFNNIEYSDLISELIGETNYMNISNRSKMARMRDFSEIIIRKILNIGNDTPLMLGEIKLNSPNKIIAQCIQNIDQQLKIKFVNSIEKINKMTRNAHHTEQTNKFADSEVQIVEEEIFELISMIFIQFFIDIKVDIYTEPEILFVFSLLPPNIRYKTWHYLYKKDSNNIQVVDKLCLSIIKANSKEDAIDWLKSNKTTIMAIPYPSNQEIHKYKMLHSDKSNPKICKVPLDFESYNNIYDLLMDKVNNPKTAINEHGKMYSSFEEAKVHFEQFKIMFSNKSNNLYKLFDLMEFVYIGRKTSVKK